MTWIKGTSSSSETLTSADDIYETHIDQLRESNPPTAVVGQTSNCQYYCDRTADDVQIQTAIDYLDTTYGGGIVFIKNGVYDITATVLIPAGSRIAIIGESRYATRFVLHAGVAGGVCPTGSVFAASPNTSYLKFENLWIDGNKANQTDSGIDGSQCGIYTGSGTYAIFRDILITSATREGIYMHEYSFHMENVHVGGCGRYGIEVDGANYGALINCRGYQNGSTAFPAIGIDIVGGGAAYTSSNVKVIGGMSYQNFGQGFAARNAADVSFIGCHSLEDGTNNGVEYAEYQRSGILLQKSRRIKIIGSTFKYATWAGIHLDTCDHCTIIGNDCIGNGGTAHTGVDAAGMLITGDHHKIIGNTCTDDQGTTEQTYGINVASSIVTECIIRDNDLDDNKTAAFYTTNIGANNIIRNNIGANPESLYAQGNVTGATTFNRATGNVITATLTGNITVTLTAGVYKDDELTLILTQDATGNRTATWPSNFKKAGGTLTLSTGAAAVDVIKMAFDGTNWREIARSLNLS